jgi:hypothetical protein
MIKHGVALMKLSSSPHGTGVTSLEEFYVVMFEGHVLPQRFTTYAEAFKFSERMWAEARANVA